MVKQKEVGQAENRKATGTQLRDEKSGRFLPGNKSGGRRAMSDEVKEMLTLLAMYAEEEARSVSENQRWRIQKMFAF